MFSYVADCIGAYSLDPGSFWRGNEPGDEANDKKGSQIFLDYTHFTEGPPTKPNTTVMHNLRQQFLQKTVMRKGMKLQLRNR